MHTFTQRFFLVRHLVLFLFNSRHTRLHLVDKTSVLKNTRSQRNGVSQRWIQPGKNTSHECLLKLNWSKSSLTFNFGHTTYIHQIAWCRAYKLFDVTGSVQWPISCWACLYSLHESCLQIFRKLSRLLLDFIHEKADVARLLAKKLTN